MSGLGQSIFQQGIQQGSLSAIISLVKKGLLKIADAANEVGMSESDFLELLKEENKKES